MFSEWLLVGVWTDVAGETKLKVKHARTLHLYLIQASKRSAVVSYLTTVPLPSAHDVHDVRVQLAGLCVRYSTLQSNVYCRFPLISIGGFLPPFVLNHIVRAIGH